MKIDTLENLGAKVGDTVYSELALGYDSYGEKSLGDLLVEFRSALGSTYQGYKGGDNVMIESTTLWVANYGSSGSTVIVDLTYDGYHVIINTDYQPF